MNPTLALTLSSFASCPDAALVDGAMNATPNHFATNATLDAAAADLATSDTLARIMEVVRLAARALTGADGATFVLWEERACFYADEDAIGPLWKGRRFAPTSCISGWVMMNGQPVVIENVFADPRIPLEVYQPTFVRSMVMVPVGERTPIAAIGAYWATSHRATSEQLKALQSLADYTRRAMQRIPRHVGPSVGADR